MPIEVVTIPCLADNYAFLVHDSDTGDTALVDAPAAGPILKTLETRGWTLTDVWITHHHYDHTQALAEILAAQPAKVRGAAAEAALLPPLDDVLDGACTFDFAGHQVEVLEVPGHTNGHIAYYIADADTVFTADSLMALGCGRLTEGTAEQMWASLSKIAALPPQTIVCSGHEYTETNAKFALTIDPDNPQLQDRAADVAARRARREPTVPSALALEMATNPFLRPHDPGIRARLNKQEAADVEVFAEIRARKDAF